MSQNPIISIIEKINTTLNASELIDYIENIEFWQKIIPTYQKFVEKRNPNVLYISISENFQLDPIGITKTKLKIDGEIIFERKGIDEKGFIIDFYIRNNSHLEKWMDVLESEMKIVH